MFKLNSVLCSFLVLFSFLSSTLQAIPQPQTLQAGANEFNRLESITRNGSTEGKIIAVLSMLVGLFVAVAGYRLFKAALFIAGFIMFSDITFAIMVRVEPTSGYANRELLLFLVPCAVGVLGGFLAYRLWIFGLSIIGALGGGTVAALLLNMGVRNALSSDAGRIVFVIAFVILGAVIIHLLEKPVIIISTALLGSYTTFLGLDTFTNTGFNSSIQNVLLSGINPSSVSGTEIGMVLGVLVLTGISCTYQYHSTKDHKHRHD